MDDSAHSQSPADCIIEDENSFTQAPNPQDHLPGFKVASDCTKIHESPLNIADLPNGTGPSAIEFKD